MASKTTMSYRCHSDEQYILRSFLYPARPLIKFMPLPDDVSLDISSVYLPVW